MKRVLARLLLVAVLSLLGNSAFAQLYLAVDPDQDHVEYMIEFDGNTMGPMPPIEKAADAVKIMDIEPFIIVNNQHTVRVAAANAWGDLSEWSDPFEFLRTAGGGVVERQTPAAPVSIRLLSE